MRSRGCRTYSVCRPGCMLPCCAPSRRCSSSSPKAKRCTFLQSPARCSPPPPACVVRPCRPRKPCSSPYRPRCVPCDPCYTPRRPARTKASSRCYSRACRPQWDSSPITSCLPDKYIPPDPCVPRRRTSRCDPCVLSIGDLCYPTRPCRKSPSCRPSCRYKGTRTKTESSCCRYIRSPVSTPCEPCQLSATSFCGNDCASPNRSRLSRSCRRERCRLCKCDPCCCTSNPNFCATDDSDRIEEDASLGPTKWFLKKSEKLGNCKNTNEQHFCPWEADVTVSGTVRAHCTSTAMEVARRLTGRFASHGKRFTNKNGSCEPTPLHTKSQRMTLGFLDDGSRLDFCRKANQEENCDKCQNSSQSFNGGANDEEEIEVKEQKLLGKGGACFTTAYIGNAARRERKSRERYKNENNAAPSSKHPDRKKRYSRRWESAHCKPRDYRRKHYQAYEVDSDTDHSNSAYKTASESLPDGEDTQDVTGHTSRYSNRGRFSEGSEERGYRSYGTSTYRGRAWRSHCSPNFNSGQDYIAGYSSDSESGINDFYQHNRYGSNYDNNASTIDDIDDAFYQERSMADKCARAVDQFIDSPVPLSLYNRTDTGSRSSDKRGNTSPQKIFDRAPRSIKMNWGYSEDEFTERGSLQSTEKICCSTEDSTETESTIAPRSKYLSRRKKGK